MANEKLLTINHDVVIIGAGISGINAAYRLQTQTPNLSYTILEGRERMGGTWDLFKYPGIRSDSDLYTFGFAFEPWTKPNPIADAESILSYLHKTAKKYHIDEKIQYRHKVTKLNWRTENQEWDIEVVHDNQTTTHHARFIIMGTGYYDYNEPLEAGIPGIENFKGQVVHPQFWPENLDYTDKRITIIGSGATAITLLPNLAKKASHVTQLQRSPSYYISLPQKDPIDSFCKAYLPSFISNRLVRFKYLIMSYLFFQFCRYFPEAAKNVLRKGVVTELPANFSIDPHFKPSYLPWDQRMCITPGGDYFEPLRSGKADIKTDTIKTVTEDGILLTSGEKLSADIIVTATGLKMQVGGGAELFIDNKPISIPNKFLWKGVMLQDIPNLFYVIGYANASWTLAADVTAQLITRIINKLDAQGLKSAVPRMLAEERVKLEKEAVPIINLSSTYVQSAMSRKVLPLAGKTGNWRAKSNYFKDLFEAKFGNIQKGLEFR